MKPRSTGIATASPPRRDRTVPPRRFSIAHIDSPRPHAATAMTPASTAAPPGPPASTTWSWHNDATTVPRPLTPAARLHGPRSRRRPCHLA